MTTEISSYEKQGIDFLKATKTEMKVEFLRHGKHFDDDTKKRDIYKITLSRGGRTYSFEFGQSIYCLGRFANPNFKEPNAYDILTCLTKYDPGTLENFCSEFGYDLYSKNVKKTYKAVVDEWLNVERLFSPEEIEQLQEIQ